MTLVALALGGMLPAFGASPAPAITGYAATNAAGVPITSAPHGASLLILGANFGTTSGTVAFAGIPAPPPSRWSPTEILVAVPAAPSYPFTGPVTVTANGQTASGPAFTITSPPALRPGDLDPSFRTGGKVVTAFTGDAVALAMAVQPDGRIVAAGGAEANGKANFGLARYNTDVSLDTAFGTGGTVVTVYKSGYSVANAVALQPDGRIVAAGRILIKGKNQFGLARFNVDGSQDTAFGTGGTVLTDFGDQYSGADAVAMQPDGRIVVAGGFVDASGQNHFALVRYKGDGSQDTGFGTGGTVLTDFHSKSDAWPGATAVAVQPDGQIVAAGAFGSVNGNRKFALARYQGR